MTTPFDSVPRVSVQTLAAAVTAGPDAGARKEADLDTLTIGTAPGNDLQLSDTTVSRYHVELSRTDKGIAIVDLESTNGTFVNQVNVQRGTVPVGSTLVLGGTSVHLSDGPSSFAAIVADDGLGDLMGRTPAMKRLMGLVERASRNTVPVLIVGESGTGKELIARALHDAGPRAKGPLVTVDCGSMTPTLIASELFGHERGAFTGAERERVGAFERAHGGTLFLDEIGELPIELQPQLLGALERHRFCRVGGQREIEVDVRVVCATNRDLRIEVNRGRFRLDLFYRIAVVTLRPPPLRERAGDIPMLLAHFAKQAGYAGDVTTLIAPEVMARLEQYEWPGNVRELRNWLDASLAMGTVMEVGGGVGCESLDGSLSIDDAHPRDPEELTTYKSARGAVLARFELDYLPRLLAAADGNVARAARMAEIDRTYLFRLMQRHGLR